MLFSFLKYNFVIEFFIKKNFQFLTFYQIVAKKKKKKMKDNFQVKLHSKQEKKNIENLIFQKISSLIQFLKSYFILKDDRILFAKDCK